MKEMSHEASQLIHAGREAFRPTETDRARLMAALTGAATLSIGAAAAAAGAQRSLSAIFGFGHAARVLAIALPVAAAGTYWWQANAQSPGTLQTPVAPAAAVVAPRSTSPVQPPEPRAEELPNEPAAPAASPERSASPAFEPSKPANEIRQEVALLSKAQAALSRGRPQEALEALAEHAARFPRGALTEERVATRARTLCALGRKPEAEAELKRIEKLNPSSAYLARARESCGSR
jgi:tetratricopeptide (TPR) repeat protein